MKTHSNDHPVTPHTIKELSVAYRVSRPVIRQWLRPFKDEIGPRIGHYYNVAQVKIIFEHLGKPHNMICVVFFIFYSVGYRVQLERILY